MITQKQFRLSMLAAALISLPLQAAQANEHSRDDHHKGSHEEQHQEHFPIKQLMHQIEQLKEQVANLQNQVGTLAAIIPYVSLETVDGKPTIRFSGVNLQVVNGTGSTATANALGNLIIGYNEADASGLYHCTIGTNTAIVPPAQLLNEAACVAANGQWVNTGFKTGSHYLVLGTQNNYSRWGGLISGVSNTSNYDFANVNGGNQNTASGLYSSVSAGWRNAASGGYSSVSGGSLSTASGHLSSISGGDSNTASGRNSSVVAGAGNTAGGILSAVSGGNNQTASGDLSSVSGGQYNTAFGRASSVSGGENNSANGDWSHVCGGNTKTANSTDGVACLHAP